MKSLEEWIPDIAFMQQVQSRIVNVDTRGLLFSLSVSNHHREKESQKKHHDRISKKRSKMSFPDENHPSSGALSVAGDILSGDSFSSGHPSPLSECSSSIPPSCSESSSSIYLQGSLLMLINLHFIRRRMEFF
ncbi:hypothetical protein GEMRC1_013650 [Eukaryota sp. GEM-RC1]